MPFSMLSGQVIVGGFGHLGSRVVGRRRGRGLGVAHSTLAEMRWTSG